MAAGKEHPYPSNVFVPSFVTVKLSEEISYNVWKTQMLCLMESHDMLGFINEKSDLGKKNADDYKLWRRSDALVKGWILGSLSQKVLVNLVNTNTDFTAKDLWDRLQTIYGPPPQAAAAGGDSTSFAKTNTIKEDPNSVQVIVDKDRETTEMETKNEDTQNRKYYSIIDKKKLHEVTIKGDWSKVESILKENEGLATEAIGRDGSTILHIAVGIGHNDFVKKLFLYVKDEQVLKKRGSDGSTLLHIAAIVGNKRAAELLVKKNHDLLQIEDYKGEKPLHKAFEHMHFDTIGYLLKAINDDDGKNEFLSSLVDSAELGDEYGIVDLLVNAISAKRYGLALDIVKFPNSASISEDVLMAMAKTFPSGLDDWEIFIYPPSLDSILENLQVTAWRTVKLLGFPALVLSDREMFGYGALIFLLTIGTVLAWVAFPFVFIYILILVVRVIFVFLYSLWWKAAKILFAPIKHIEGKKKEWNEATKVLELVCDQIDKLEYYTQPLLAAACHNAYKVVDEILFRSPEAIEARDKNGYDIIQLAIINRSEQIYNLIYVIGERKNFYRRYKDSSENNILHLAGKLAHSSVLNQRTGAALQLQRELQWYEEVKKLVIPTYITQENMFNETPEMVSTREHENLVKEGERWMKTTAESCSITAALITTIVFAAAITVPGGSNQDKGIPLFKKKTAFIIFAISDAISLFSSTTALLVFLSVLTARFAEKDFLVSLPRRLFIGLFSLLLSTTAMMVAYSATLFLVFCDETLWMLAPICGLALTPIAFFVGLQFPLMMDLFRSTYLHVLGKTRTGFLRRFNPDDIRLRFSK